MTGDERFPEPGPVAEYRDPELVRRFESEPVPQHGAGFWNDLEARLGGGRAEPDPAAEASPLLSTSVHLAADPTPRVDPTGGRRWGPGRWLAAAAATLALLGLGGAVLVAQGRSSAPVESAAPSPQGEAGSDDGEETAPSSTSTSQQRTTETSAPSTTTTASSAPVDRPPDYLSDAVRVDGVGPGEVVAFSPDDSAVLVLDDGAGVATGCEGGELQALFSQDLATGRRLPAFGDAVDIETGGVELAISPFGSTPGEVGTRPVYGQEWCDGQAISLWRGVMGTDGQISTLEPLAIGSADDPFVGRQSIPAEDEGLISPDGRYALVASGSIGSAAGVVELDEEGNPTGPVLHPVPDGIAAEGLGMAVWAPTSDAIALAADGAVILWGPWTGGYQRFESDAIIDLVFDNAGGRLAVVSNGDQVTSTILTFGDRPAPVPAPPRCSGRIPFAPLPLESTSDQGLPTEVVTTAEAIDAAAAVCDWAALERLTPERFVASFGDGGAVDIWVDEEANGRSPMWYLRTALRQPHVIDDSARPAFHIWPAIFLDTDCGYSETDKGSLTALGYDAVQMEQACRTDGGYLGYRTAIDASGVWRYFVAGD